MRRKTRKPWNTPGDHHELTFSCHNGWRILGSDEAKGIFLQKLDDARIRCNFSLRAYVVMPEHVHLLIQPRDPEYRMDRILRAIKGPSSNAIVRYLRRERPNLVDALAVKRPSGRVEHRVWLQGGGYDRNISDVSELGTAIDYIHFNPVKRELCTEPCDWRWSSALAYYGGGAPPIAVDFDNLG